VGTVTYPYEKIAADLRAAILDGHLGPGDLIPSSTELATRYGTTRNTVRRALEMLHSDGLIDTRQGARPQVRMAPVVRIWGDGADWRRHREAQRPGFDATVAEHGLTPRQEIVDVQDPMPAPTHVAVKLGLDGGAPVVMRFVRQFADEVPVRLVRMFFDASWASGTVLAGRKRIRGGVAAFIEDVLGRHLADSEVELEGRNATEDEKDLLHLARGITIMDVVRTFLDDGGEPVFVQEEIADASRHRYRFRVPL
jgi:GntR family transcriptional regulator